MVQVGLGARRSRRGRRRGPEPFRRVAVGAVGVMGVMGAQTYPKREAD